MSDRLALTNAFADTGMDRAKAEHVATVIFDAIRENVATKAADIDPPNRRFGGDSPLASCRRIPVPITIDSTRSRSPSSRRDSMPQAYNSVLTSGAHRGDRPVSGSNKLPLSPSLRSSRHG